MWIIAEKIQLPICVGLRSREIFPVYFSLFVGVFLAQLTVGGLVCETLQVSFLSLVEDSAKLPILLKLFLSPSYHVSWALGMRVFCRCIHWGCLHHFPYWIVTLLCVLNQNTQFIFQYQKFCPPNINK